VIAIPRTTECASRRRLCPQCVADPLRNDPVCHDRSDSGSYFQDEAGWVSPREEVRYGFDQSLLVDADVLLTQRVVRARSSCARVFALLPLADLFPTSWLLIGLSRFRLRSTTVDDFPALLSRGDGGCRPLVVVEISSPQRQGTRTFWMPRRRPSIARFSGPPTAPRVFTRFLTALSIVAFVSKLVPTIPR